MLSDENALLRAICEQPECDARRLVYADWLEEQDTWESVRYAGYIRDQIGVKMVSISLVTLARFESALGVQPHQTKRAAWAGHEIVSTADGLEFHFRRGLVSHVRCPRDRFFGPRCDVMACNGTGRNSELGQQCENCNGTGRLFRESTVAQLFEKSPITSVNIDDAIIYPSSGNNTYYLGGVTVFPSKYWRELDQLPSVAHVRGNHSLACVNYAREMYDLQPLPLDASPIHL